MVFSDTQTLISNSNFFLRSKIYKNGNELVSAALALLILGGVEAPQNRFKRSRSTSTLNSRRTNKRLIYPTFDDAQAKTQTNAPKMHFKFYGATTSIILTSKIRLRVSIRRRGNKNARVLLRF